MRAAQWDSGVSVWRQWETLLAMQVGSIRGNSHHCAWFSSIFSPAVCFCERLLCCVLIAHQIRGKENSPNQLASLKGSVLFPVWFRNERDVSAFTMLLPPVDQLTDCPSPHSRSLQAGSVSNGGSVCAYSASYSSSERAWWYLTVDKFKGTREIIKYCWVFKFNKFK